ncbi:hypothetical protein K2173_000999 [Erythroxylum novogranatense]|uniref:Retrovirus-related Pol polyprotein from transposon RE2 n=1 Tax=Erythroxylum novogranatense TaxID=1862640 RepID=A0AAV8TT11_9ROSI|nr:hypothetical protein K2173_000999 [Erythroxylum novogranatense]
MTDAKPVLTPIPTSPPLLLKSGTPLSDPTEYRTIVGSLQYLLLTRPDIAFAVNKLSQYMHTPTTEHWTFVKRLLRYLCRTINEGLQLHRQSPLHLHAFSDADWLCSNPVFHSRMKHVAIDFHFIREQVQNGVLRVAHVSSADQLADTLTKPLPRGRFLDLKSKIGVLSRAPS